jgi:hypothetical protein
MEWLEDVYTITVPDAAAVYVRRGWNPRTRKWECAATPAENTAFRLRAIAIWVSNAAGAIKLGVQGFLEVRPSESPYYYPIYLSPPAQGGRAGIVWSGDFPLSCGAGWTLLQGAVIAGDIVRCYIGYERERYGR